MCQNDALLSSFEAAAETVRRSQGLSSQRKLELYGLYKQGTKGDCGEPRPGFWDMEGQAKWRAWRDRAGMATSAAMQAYVDLASENDTTETFGVAVSTMAEPEGADMDDSDDPEIIRAARDGDVTDDLLSQIAAVDAEGRTALHWAADRGRADLCKRLLDAGASIDHKDATGLTALAYAVTCDYDAVVSVLLKAGADPLIPDDDGVTPLDLSKGSDLHHLFAKEVDSSSSSSVPR